MFETADQESKPARHFWHNTSATSQTFGYGAYSQRTKRVLQNGVGNLYGCTRIVSIWWKANTHSWEATMIRRNASIQPWGMKKAVKCHAWRILRGVRKRSCCSGAPWMFVLTQVELVRMRGMWWVAFGARLGNYSIDLLLPHMSCTLDIASIFLYCSY